SVHYGLKAFHVNGQDKRSPDRHSLPLWGIGVAPGSGLVVTAGSDGQLYIHDFEGKKEKYTDAKATLKGHDGPARGVALRRGGTVAVTGGIDGKVIVWDLNKEKALHVLEHGMPVLSVAIACDGKLVASGGIDGSL